MTKHSLKMIDGDEWDALTRTKRYFSWRPGDRAAIKRRYSKRVRRVAKLELKTVEE